VFDKFFRVPGTTASGAGLGLYIAREITLAHEGLVTVASQPGGGATFVVELPVQG
jgi:signal transduction histidine kinase